MDTLTDIEALPFLAIALGLIFKETEGVIIHRDDKAYAIFNEDGQIKIDEDENYKQYKHGSWVWMHREPVGNA